MEDEIFLYTGMLMQVAGVIWIIACTSRIIYPKIRRVLPAPDYSATITLPNAGQYAIAISLPRRNWIGSELPGASFYSADFTLNAANSSQHIVWQRSGKLRAFAHNRDFQGNKMHIIGFFACHHSGNYDVVCTNPDVIAANYKVEIVSHMPISKHIFRMLPGWLLIFVAMALIIPQYI